MTTAIVDGLSDTLPCISLHQPWASAILAGLKPYETRDRSAPEKYIGRRIAIHASKTREWLVDRSDRPLDVVMKSLMRSALGPGWLNRLPLGAVIATAILQGCYRVGDEIAPTSGQLRILRRAVGSVPLHSIPCDAFGDYNVGRWAWWLDDVRPVDPPAPALGRQGWFTWTPT